MTNTEAGTPTTVVCTCAMNADGGTELPYDADCAIHGHGGRCEHLFKPVKGQTGCAVCGYARGHHPTAATLRAEAKR